MRRIRCFFCNELVEALPSRQVPFAIYVLNIGKKHGCICSECVQTFYEDYEDLSPTQDDDMEVSFSQRPSMLNGFVIKVAHKPSDDSCNPKEKFPCLDYSLASYVSAIEKKVFGQEEALRRLVYTLYHNQMANLLEELGHPAPPREHVLLIGSTGVGKTFLSTTVLQAMKIPYAKSDASAITSAGYVGDNVEDILERLYHATNRNLEAAQNGVIIIDEIDKKRKSDDEFRDINGLSVQQELLKVLEPSTVWIERGTIPFDTSHLTIILCGAFVGLDKVVENRLHKRQIGFSNEGNITSDVLSNIEPTDLVKYGFIEEFVGRIPNPIVLKPLSHSTIMDIIYSCLNEQNHLFQAKGFDLIVDEAVLNKIVDRVIAHNTGARDVKKEIETLLYPAKYKILESASGGICEIDANGNTSILLKSEATSNPQLLQIAGQKYLQEES